VNNIKGFMIVCAKVYVLICVH